MVVVRLDNEERRRGIVEAAVPLFARKGFAGTTTKEIAEAARVSEALVFKHFPSKAALYEEIVRLGCQGDPGLEYLNTLEASTGTLIDVVHFMLRHFVRGISVASIDARHRLTVYSFLADGEYARLVFDWVLERIYPKIEECLRAAQAAGDLAEMPIPLENRFWFGQHVAAMMGYVRLSGRCAVPYSGDTDSVITQAAWFILRGFGIKDAIIAAHPVPADPPLCSADMNAVNTKKLNATENSLG